MKIKSIITALTLALFTAISAKAEVRYVFYFIGDGMGIGHVVTTNYYLQQLHGQAPLLMTTFPVTTYTTTYSLTGPITDSAAAGTALACGQKTLNGMEGMAADSTAITSIASQLKDAGWGVGIITSVPADDATPSAFYAHQPSRKMRYELAMDGAKSNFDIIGGSTLHAFGDHKGRPDILGEYRKNGYKVAYGVDTVAPGKDAKVLLLANKPQHQLPYAIDSVADVTTLADMTHFAIDHLAARTPERFFLMVEGGNIDYAGHSTDGVTAIHEIINYQKPIDMAYQFYLQHPDETLIVVAADHDTSGFTIGHRKGQFSLVDSQRISKSQFSDICNKLFTSDKAPSWDEMQQLLTKYLGFWDTVQVDKKRTKALKHAFEEAIEARGKKDTKGLYEDFNKFVVTVFDTFAYYAALDYIIDYHIGSPTPLFAVGANSQLFNAARDNTDIPLTILKAVNK